MIASADAFTCKKMTHRWLMSELSMEILTSSRCNNHDDHLANCDC